MTAKSRLHQSSISDVIDFYMKISKMVQEKSKASDGLKHSVACLNTSLVLGIKQLENLIQIFGFLYV